MLKDQSVKSMDGMVSFEHTFHLLQVPADSDFENLVKMVSCILDAEAMFITFNENGRQFVKTHLKSEVALDPKVILFAHHMLDEALTISQKFHREFLKNVSEYTEYLSLVGSRIYNESGEEMGAICLLNKKETHLTEHQTEYFKLFLTEITIRISERKKRKALQQEKDRLKEDLYNTRKNLGETKSDIRQLRKSLKDHEIFLRKVLDTCPQMIYVKDQQGRFTLVNAAMARFFNSDSRDIIGKTYKDFGLEMTGEPFDSEELEAISSGQQIGPFDQKFTRNGAIHWFQTLKMPLANNHGESSVLGVSTNITELKKLELELEEKNKELENLIYSLSHDLRGPVSSILGLMDIEQYSSEEDLRHYFKMIKIQASKMDSSIHDLVHLKNVTNKRILPGKFLLSDLLKEIHLQLRNSPVDFEFQCPHDLYTTSDKYMLKMALLKIVENAIRFRDEKKQYQTVKIVISRKSSQVNILVSDNGIGINKKHLSRIFDMFFKGPFSGGAGLGLYITEKALQRIKGDISVNSELGEGTTFSLNIPDVQGFAS